MTQKQKLTFLIFINIVIFSLLAFLVWQNVKIFRILKTSPLVIENKKISSFPKEDRIRTYQIITQESRDPKITEITLNPYNPQKGETQTVMVRLETSAITITNRDYVKGTAITDNKSINFPLKLKKVEGNKKTISVWQGSWQLEDSIEKNLQVRILASNEQGKHVVTITLR